MQRGIPLPLRLKVGLLTQQAAGARRPYKGARTPSVHVQAKANLYLSRAP